MTTERLLELIDAAEVRADVVPYIAVLLPPKQGAIDWKAVNAAIVAKWSRAARTWIFTRAWKIAENKVRA